MNFVLETTLSDVLIKSSEERILKERY